MEDRTHELVPFVSKELEQKKLYPENGGGTALESLNSIAQRPSVELQFEDLTYTVTDKNCESGVREILCGISGKFKPGELTAIMGPSGAGKSTLLNILTGYTCTNFDGSITVNGYKRDMRIFKKLSSYIMQDDLIQPHLSVQEAMDMVANLKLPESLGNKTKSVVVEEIISTLGLSSCKHTRAEMLSGGQRKRLSVALELINNPPIIFLDEPTTGLDFVSIKQCLSFLKLLVNNGRTIICTIHQPAASLLSLFDNVYIVAKGQCVFHGPPEFLVPFMTKSGVNCSTLNNPADLIIETVHSNDGIIEKMTILTDNGAKREGVECEKSNGPIKIYQKILLTKDEDMAAAVKLGFDFPTSFTTQFGIILKRMFLQKCRNKLALWIQLLHHVITALFLGGIFYDIGNDADKPITNFKFCFTIVIFFTYTYVMVPILIYPTELKHIKREYFNRWYGFNAYFAALIVSGIPFLTMLGMVTVTITYLMSGQLLEWDRFLFFSITAMVTGMCAEGFGYAVSSIYNAKNGSIIAPTIIIPCFAISLYGIGFGPKIEAVMKFFMRISYVRYSLAAFSSTVFDNRPKMQCEQLYCHYSNTKLLMKEVGMENTSYGYEMLGIVAFAMLYRFIAYFTLRYKLQTDMQSRLPNCLNFNS